MFFSCNVSFSSLPVFLPTVLKDMGSTAINAQELTAPPYSLSFLVTIFPTLVVDRLQQRGLVFALLALVFFEAVPALALRMPLAWENRRLGKRFDALADRNARRAEGKEMAVGEENYGPDYRLVL